jgi:hypothetical protein
MERRVSEARVHNGGRRACAGRLLLRRLLWPHHGLQERAQRVRRREPLRAVRRTPPDDLRLCAPLRFPTVTLWCWTIRAMCDNSSHMQFCAIFVSSAWRSELCDQMQDGEAQRTDLSSFCVQARTSRFATTASCRRWRASTSCACPWRPGTGAESASESAARVAVRGPMAALSQRVRFARVAVVVRRRRSCWHAGDQQAAREPAGSRASPARALDDDSSLVCPACRV